MTLAEMLARQAPVLRVPEVRSLIRANLSASNNRLVVIDDDPTGTQTVHDTRVFLGWSVDVLRKALAGNDPVFFISTNSRSLDAPDAETLGFELGRNLREAAQVERVDPIVASRSDSTLRGHFPGEVDAVSNGLQLKHDGVIIVPAFFEGGRYTIDDIQWVQQGGNLIPAHETEFARDPVFGFKHSNLKDWVAEKTDGRVRSADIRSISLELLRQSGPDAVSALLSNVSGGTAVVANAACYEDLEVLVLGIVDAESRGKRFIYRCAASFVKVRGGFGDRGLLTPEELVSGAGPGLIVVGSYVDKTSRQLAMLLDSGQARGIEIKVAQLEREEDSRTEVRRVSNLADAQLSQGLTTVLYTSRGIRSTRGQTFLATGKNVMAAVCEIVRSIKARPNYVVSKGGITSIDVARNGLSVEQAVVLGQIIKGVPVWRLSAEARWPGIPYVVFPGNVGDDSALSDVVETLQRRHRPVLLT